MNELKIVASEALQTIEAIAKSAAERLREPGLSLAAIASLNQATSENLAKNISERNLERRTNLATLLRRPAIARLELVDEDENVETIYIAPNAEVTFGDIKICSYLNNKGKGRLASLPVGEGAEIILPAGSRYYEVRQKLTFDLTLDADVWDSRPARQFFNDQPPLTIKSLRELLRQDGFSDEDIYELDRQLAAADVADNIIQGLQRSVITAMQMRVEPLLNKYQSEIFRLPLDSKLALLGPPGSGKTTTLIKRLSQKLDVAYLEPEEQEIVDTPGPSGLNHAHSWLMFTPTALLKEYVKSAFSREDVPVTDDRIQTWEDFRQIIARRYLPILRSGKRKGMVPRSNAGILLPETSLNQIAWFEAFTEFEHTLFLSELKIAAKHLAETAAPEIAAVGNRMETAIELSKGQLGRLMAEVVRLLEDVQNLAVASRNDTRQRLRTILSFAVRDDKLLLDDLARYLAALTLENEDDLDDPDGDDEEEEAVPPRGIRAAESAFYKALRAKAATGVTKRPFAKTSRNAHVLTWLETRGTILPPLEEIGVAIQLQRAMVQISRAPTNFVTGIPNRYRRFRREAVSEGKWYATLPAAADADLLELDIIILAMLRAGRQMTSDARLMRSLGDNVPAVFSTVTSLFRNQILVDESTDFSPIQLACMTSLVDPRIDSFFAIGDFNQRLTTWGTRTQEELEWVLPGIEIREVDIVYRQSSLLNEFASKLADASPETTAPKLPEFMENQGVAPVLGIGLLDRSRLAEWIAERIKEIEAFSETLPSIAVLVNHENELQPLADALNEALADQAIRAIACPKGQAMGPENDVRIFEVKYIKGLEFEAIFFVDVDELARQEPDLFERYIYVGATRAATFLGVSCSGTTIPAPLNTVSEMFADKW